MKKLLTVVSILILTISLTACSLLPGDKDKPVEPVAVQFESSEEVIQAYFNAFKTVSKDDFIKCFPADETELALKQYNHAESLESTVTFRDVVSGESKIYDLANLNEEIVKSYNITRAETTDVTFKLDQIIDGTTYAVNDYYTIITIKLDSGWYIAQVIDTGADLDESKLPAEDSENNEITTYSGVSYLTPEVQDALESLDTDYSKVNWGVRYSPFEDYPGIVFSITPYTDEYDTSNLIIGITNLYDESITLSGEGKALGADKAEVGSMFIFADSIGSGNTYITYIRCDEDPSGEISWTDLQLKNSYHEYVPWTADWELEAADTGHEFRYEISADTPMKPGDIYGLALNESGFVVQVFHDYDAESNQSHKGTIRTYRDLNSLGVKDVALFTNPVK